MRRFRNVVHTLTALALGMSAACGGDTASPKQSTMSPAEARAVASALFGEITRAVGSPTPAPSNNVASQSVVGSPTVTASINATCSKGGTIGGTFTLTSDVNTAGTGTVSGAVTVAANHCNVDTGERVISADGGYNYAFHVGLTNHVPSSDFVWVATGTLTWTGGSCTLDYTVTISKTGARTLTGTVCGVDVSGSSL